MLAFVDIVDFFLVMVAACVIVKFDSSPFCFGAIESSSFVRNNKSAICFIMRDNIKYVFACQRLPMR